MSRRVESAEMSGFDSARLGDRSGRRTFVRERSANSNTCCADFAPLSSGYVLTSGHIFIYMH